MKSVLSLLSCQAELISLRIQHGELYLRLDRTSFSLNVSLKHPAGFPGCEFQIREALTEAIGQEKSDFFFDKVPPSFSRTHPSLTISPQFLEYSFQDEDAACFKSLGLNCIHLPFNYRHFEDDMNPRVLEESGFKRLDRVIAKHGIHIILYLHTAPGGQNTDWHSDHGGHIANSWNHKDFQDRVLWL
ncbi:hypothetical protein GALMADRAFT_259730 [Galerina marginata CBS 339.88]|uniref:Glycoside hydrolase family 5 domain-containing protein n=1 Tax=Galerina marginata (strain CBS 339.88) TaxID=685588 RepID=A0A067S5Y5_GALM3|nr:hypothetical protein GALMADRAFT_259730 [Galerina marginata CBS 339.88]